MEEEAKLQIVVVIPAFQAATTIGSVVHSTRAALPGAKIVVVDDGSTDGTSSTIAETVLTHEKNLGKGAALRAGRRTLWMTGP